MQSYSQQKTIALSVGISLAVTFLIFFLLKTYAPQYLYSLLMNPAHEDERILGLPSPISPEYASEIIPDIVERVAPAVVSVVITADVPVIEQYFEDWSPFGDLFGGEFGFQVPKERQYGTEKREIGAGTGFFVSSDGYIITNKHVVDTKGAEFSIITNDGETFDAKVVAKDPLFDIAILKVEGDTPFRFLEFGDDSTVRLGSTVIAIGNALAEFPNSVSVGVISGLSRTIVAGDTFGTTEVLEGVIQTDAAINQGNSGGPLINLDGKVIGVNVAMAGNSENIGFSLPGGIVQNVYESVKEHGEIIRPFVGIRYIQIDAGMSEQNALDVDYGILIARGDRRSDLAIIPGSPADKAGLEENDIILEVDGEKLDGKRSFANIIRGYAVDDTITLKVLHDGEEKTVSVTLEKAPQE